MSTPGRDGTRPAHAGVPGDAARRLRVHDVQLNLDAYTVRGGHAPPMALPGKEFQLLQVLMRHPGQLVSHADLLAVVRPEGRPDSGTVATHIRRLRQRLETDPHRPTLITTVRGQGYLFTTNATPLP